MPAARYWARALVVAGCAAVLFGHRQFRVGRLPPRGRSVQAILPGCGDDDQPALAGQRLVVRTSRCGQQTLADRIAFRGATVRLECVDASLGEDEGGGVGATLRLALIAAELPLCLATIGRWWGAPSSRPSR